jgi:hypothetical protein
LGLAGISALSQPQKALNSATRAVASTFGVLVGLAGVEHGIFEMLQGNVTPSGLMIDAIGPAQRFWEYGTERALTIIPNFFVTGTLAIVFGILVMVCSSIESTAQGFCCFSQSCCGWLVEALHQYSCQY